MGSKIPAIEPSDAEKLKKAVKLVHEARKLGISADCSLKIRIRVGARLGTAPIAREFETRVNHVFPNARLTHASSSDMDDFYEYEI